MCHPRTWTKHAYTGNEGGLLMFEHDGINVAHSAPCRAQGTDINGYGFPEKKKKKKDFLEEH